MYCRNCGNEISDIARFCPKCGTVQAQPQGQDLIRDTEPYIEEPIIHIDPPGQPVRPSSYNPGVDKRRKRMPAAFVGVLSALIVLVVGIVLGLLVYDFYMKSKDEDYEFDINDIIDIVRDFGENEEDYDVKTEADNPNPEKPKTDDPEEEEIELKYNEAICEHCGKKVLTNDWHIKSDGTYYPEEHDYEVFVEDVTWKEARTKCEKMGGHLVTFVSLEEMKRVEKLLDDEGANACSIWIGIRLNWLEDGSYEPVVLVEGESGVSNWYPGEPNHYDPDSGKEERFIKMVYTPGETGNGLDWTWMDNENDISAKYSGKIGYICEWDHYVAE